MNQKEFLHFITSCSQTAIGRHTHTHTHVCMLNTWSSLSHTHTHTRLHVKHMVVSLSLTHTHTVLCWLCRSQGSGVISRIPEEVEDISSEVYLCPPPYRCTSPLH